MSEDEKHGDWDDEELEELEEAFSDEDLRIPTAQEFTHFFSGAEEGTESEMEEHKHFKPGKELEVKVIGVFEHAEPSQPVHTFVLLKDNKGRRVPILIGRFEALSISIALNGDTTERPLSHDLMALMLERLGTRIDRVVIDDLWRETFYAKIYLTRDNQEIERDNQEIEIDGRPSDAIALALRFRAPIYMSENVVETVVRASED